MGFGSGNKSRLLDSVDIYGSFGRIRFFIYPNLINMDELINFF